MPSRARLTITTPRYKASITNQAASDSAIDSWLAASPPSKLADLVSADQDFFVDRLIQRADGTIISDQGYCPFQSDLTSFDYTFANYPIPLILCFAGQSNMSGEGLLSDLPGSGFPANPTLLTNDAKDYLPHTAPDPSASEPISTTKGIVDVVANDGAVGVGPMLKTADVVAGSKAKRVILIPCSKGGTAVSVWQPGSDPEDRTTLFGSMLHRCKLAQTRFRASISAFLWYQGEADATTTPYDGPTFAANTQTIFDTLRTQLSLPNMPVIIVELPATAATGGVNWSDVRSRQAAMAQSSPPQIVVQAPSGPYTDGTLTHLATSAQLTLGQSLGDAYNSHF